MNHSPHIAIVGVAGRFPGSGADLGQFWDNVRTAADCSRNPLVTVSLPQPK